MEPTVRRLVDADIDVVVGFALAAWAPVFASFEAVLGPRVSGLVFPDWRSAQARAIEGVCRAPDTLAWVALVADRPVGFVAVRYVDEGAARAGEIDMVAVDPNYQRAGVAAALVEHAVAEVQAAGVGLVVLGTGGDPGHAPARALYDKLGFTRLPQARYYRAV